MATEKVGSWCLARHNIVRNGELALLLGSNSAIFFDRGLHFQLHQLLVERRFLFRLELDIQKRYGGGQAFFSHDAMLRKVTTAVAFLDD